MKTKQLIAGAIIACALALGSFYACKKENNTQNPATPNSTLSGASASQRPATATTQTYYSADGDGTYYQMTLVWDANGNATITRAATANYPAGTVKTGVIEEGITYNLSGNILTIVPTAGLKYFFIPFNPAEPLNETNGSGDTFQLECQNQCSDVTSTCKMEPNPQGVVKVRCEGSCVDKCKLMAYRCSSGSTASGGQKVVITNTAGGVIVEANGVSE